MKAKILLQRRFSLLVLAWLGIGKTATWAQGPTIDPTFQATAVYKPASVTQVQQQSDGKRLVLSTSVRAGNQPASALVRLLANSNEPDSTFTSNVSGLQGSAHFVVLMPGGKVLLVGYNQLVLGAVSRQQLMLLNADGTPDAGFDANIPPGTGYGNNPIVNAISQPDGKVVLVCSNSLVPGAGVLVRLLPNGDLDTAFQTALSSSGTGITRAGSNVVLQADGKLVVPGNFGGKGVVRLLPTGAIDPDFNAQLTVTLTYLTSQVAVQPDGKVLVTTINNTTGSPQPLIRLTNTGAVDATFQSAVNGSFGTAFAPGPQVQVQADGKLLLSAYQTNPAGTFLSAFQRLLPGGGLDTSFDATASIATSIPNHTQLLPNGQILAVALAKYVTGIPVYRLLLLNPDGRRDPSLVPRLYSTGQVNDVVQLPGGGYLVGGDFTEINGVAAGNLARLSATGVPDPSFLAAADNEVRSLQVQADGKLLVGGAFEHIAGGNRVSLARLLPSGTLDTGFAPPFLSNLSSLDGGIARIAVLPDGRVLAAGSTKLSTTGGAEYWLRLLDATTGQPDLTIPHYQASDLVVQPSGKAVVAGFYAPTIPGIGYCLFRILPSGALDQTFASMLASRSGVGGGPVVSALAQSATGNLYLTGHYYTDAGPPTPPLLYALQPDGQSSGSATNSRFAGVTSLAVQPNGRLLVGTDLSSTTPTFGLSRVLSTLATDPSFLGTNGPGLGVNRMLVQPDGAITVAGRFTSVGSRPISGLVRLLDANVLHMNNEQLQARTQVWPVPAHQQLHLLLDPASRPQRVELLDALGRVAMARTTTQTELTLDTSPLAAGVYVLRVQYVAGPVTRRIVVE